MTLFRSVNLLAEIRMEAIQAALKQHEPAVVVIDVQRYMVGDSYSVVDMAVWGWSRLIPFVLGQDAPARFPGVVSPLKARYLFHAKRRAARTARVVICVSQATAEYSKSTTTRRLCGTKLPRDVRQTFVVQMGQGTSFFTAPCPPGTSDTSPAHRRQRPDAAPGSCDTST